MTDDKVSAPSKKAQKADAAPAAKAAPEPRLVRASKKCFVGGRLRVPGETWVHSGPDSRVVQTVEDK